MTDNVLDFPRAVTSAAPADTSVAQSLRALADDLSRAAGFAIVADMGEGKAPRVMVGGDRYETAADALFLLALGQKKILDAAVGATS